MTHTCSHCGQPTRPKRAPGVVSIMAKNLQVGHEFKVPETGEWSTVAGWSRDTRQPGRSFVVVSFDGGKRFLAFFDEDRVTVRRSAA